MAVAGVQVGLLPLGGTSDLLPVNVVRIQTSTTAAAINNPESLSSSLFPAVLTGCCEVIVTRRALMCHTVIRLKIACGRGAETSAGWSLTGIQSNLGAESVVARQRLTGNRGFDCKPPHSCGTNVCGKRKEESVGVKRRGRRGSREFYSHHILN